MRSGIPALAEELLISCFDVHNSPAYFYSAASGIRALMTGVQCAQTLFALTFTKNEDTFTR